LTAGDELRRSTKLEPNRAEIPKKHQLANPGGTIGYVLCPEFKFRKLIYLL